MIQTLALESLAIKDPRAMMPMEFVPTVRARTHSHLLEQLATAAWASVTELAVVTVRFSVADLV
jgi:hypothetical protein